MSTPAQKPFTPSTRITDATLGVALGIAGGIAHSPHLESAFLGAGFGLLFAIVFAKRCSSAGAGLIWGLSSALLLWFAKQGVTHFLHGSGSMLENARNRFPDLAFCLICLGLPVGLTFGVRGGIREPFRWGRAVVAGGLAGIASGLIFGYWTISGNFYPLIAGMPHQTATLEFGVSLLIGLSFGLLFQRDVLGLGSCMGWGLGYSLFCWFLGPLTLFPLSQGMPPDWSVENAADYFGPLVGHILYGLMLGVLYAIADRVWVRLFIQSDPLNREAEGPGFRLFRSLQWGAQAGVLAGVISAPLVLTTEMLPRMGVLEALLLHLLVSLCIGMTYGLLFRNEASSLIMASAWGWFFGLIWWYTGPLTLLPLLRTGEVDWRLSAASRLFPSLFAHLVYGAVTGSVFYLLERHYAAQHLRNPRMAAAALRRLRAAGTPAPALWLFAFGLCVAIPILLA
jgi:hypothetical protein